MDIPRLRNLLMLPTVALCAGGIFVASCSSGSGTSTPTAGTTAQAQASPSAAAPMSPSAAASGTGAAASTGVDSGAATLRANLTALLQEHVYLTSLATGAALRGDTAGFNAAAAALDTDTTDLSNAIGSVYGADAQAAFSKLWKAHIGFFVDYTTGKATNDQAKTDKAKQDLAGYVTSIADLLSGANPNLTKAAVATLFTEHVAELEAMIDAQAAKSPDQYQLTQKAADHMPMAADALAGAIAKQYPDKFPGNVDGPASALRSGLTSLLVEHVYLTSMATGDALRGDTDGFNAAAAVLETDTQGLGDAIGSVYGPDAKTKFLDMWHAHIGFFVDYTTGKATNDQAKVDKANTDLKGYITGIATFLSGANPNLPKDAVASIFTMHVQSLEAMIDAQAAKSAGQYSLTRAAAAHMPMAADALAGGIAKQFPDKFGS